MESPPRNAVSGTVVDQSRQTSLESLLGKNSHQNQEREAGSLADELMLELLEFDRLRKALANYAYSKRGQSLALSLSPAEDLKIAQERLGELSAAKTIVEDHGFWPQPPKEDIGAALERAGQQRRLARSALLEIAALLAVTDRTREYWNSIQEVPEELQQQASSARPIQKLAQRIESCVESEDRLHDRASTELKSIRDRMRSGRAGIRTRLERLVRGGGAWKGALQDGFLTVREDRYLVAVRADQFDRRKGIIQDVSSSGVTLFVEPFEVLPQNNELRELASAEVDEEGRILDELTALVADHAEDLLGLQVGLAKQDELGARVRLSKALRGSTPSLDRGADEFRLKRARHPLLWLQEGGSSDWEAASRRVVPFDLELIPPIRVLLISGPNMGGKTVALKAIGLAVVMARSGLDICAAPGAVIPAVNRMFVDIGDAQSLEDHLSTFAARLIRMDGMARAASRSTLCLSDELGAGTDPEEGAALGRSLLRFLAEKGSWVVATTHLGALKVLAAEREDVENASMAIDFDKLKPLYRLEIGVPGGSHGIATAKRLGMHPEVVLGAESSLSQDSLALEDLIAELGQELRAAREKRIEIERGLAKLEQERKALEEEQKRAVASQRAVEERRILELRAVEGQARELLRSLRREAKKSRGERDTGAIESLAGDLRTVEKSSQRWDAVTPIEGSGIRAAELKVGVEVRHRALGIVFRVVEDPTDEESVVISKGAWRMTARIADLVSVADTEPKNKAASLPAATASLARSSLDEMDAVPREVDLRGLFVDEALLELDRAIDRAILAGYLEFRVIHGVGRGVLQEAVKKHLRQHSQVKRQRLGGHGEGGRGVTLAELS